MPSRCIKTLFLTIFLFVRFLNLYPNFLWPYLKKNTWFHLIIKLGSLIFRNVNKSLAAKTLQFLQETFSLSKFNAVDYHAKMELEKDLLNQLQFT